MSCLQIQAKIVAAIEIVVSSFMLASLLAVQITSLTRLNYVSAWDVISAYALPFCYCIAELGLGILLYDSAHKLNHKRLRLWFIITTTLMAVGIISFVAVVKRLADGNYWYPILVWLVNLLFTAYSLWVVVLLIGEIKRAGHRVPVPHHRNANGFYRLQSVESLSQISTLP